jgi:hypothetical protein
MISTVQELIDRLMQIEDKSKKVESSDEFGDIKKGIELKEYNEEIEIYHP